MKELLETLRTVPTDQQAEWFKQESLRLLRQTAQTNIYPGYPSERYVSNTADFPIPIGPWDLNPGEQPTKAEQADFEALGLNLDHLKRPLHPWYREMVTDPKIGVLTGRGFYWHWGGPKYNRTADPIILRHDLLVAHVLLIDRGDTGAKALPGGFINPGETARDAAVREGSEETLLDISKFACQQVYEGDLYDIRATANAWAYTTAFRFDVPNNVARNLSLERYEGGDDAAYAQWIPVDEVSEVLFGQHSLLLALALNLENERLSI